MATPRRPYAPRLPPDERRQQILDATLALIASDGYRAVSMEGVARAIGVTKPVVYDAFPNLGGLLQALFEREEQRALATLANAIPMPEADATPDQLLIDAFGAFLRAVSENPDAWRLILVPTEATPTIVREHVDRNRAELIERVEPLVSWAVQAWGGPLADIDQRLAAQTVIVLGEHAGRLVLTDPKGYPPERIVDFLKTLVATVAR